MPTYKTRKPTRLKEYNYSENSIYFTTMCTHANKEWFGNVENNKMILNQYGDICESCWIDLPNHYNNIEIDSFVIMPNHIHGIIIINGINKNENHRENHRGRVTNPPLQDNDNYNIWYSLTEIVRGFKTFSSKKINQMIASDKFKWQRSFHDHVIRTTTSLQNIRKYIKNNPATWADDDENIKNKQ